MRETRSKIKSELQRILQIRTWNYDASFGSRKCLKILELHRGDEDHDSIVKSSIPVSSLQISKQAINKQDISQALNKIS